jgi:hypothetical protein
MIACAGSSHASTDYLSTWLCGQHLLRGRYRDKQIYSVTSALLHVKRICHEYFEPFIRRPIAASLLMAAIAFAGFVAVPFLPVAPLPQVDFPTISVSATLQGASAETMATSVAAPLERQFGQIPGVTQLTSVSTPNASSITIQLDLNRNIDSAARARHIEEAHAAEDAKNTHIGAQSAYDMIGLCRSRGTD